MKSSLESIDARWAWQPFEPSDESPWDLAAAAHLYRRAGFGGNWQQMSAAAANSPQEAVQEIFAAKGSAQAFDKEMQQLGDTLLAGGSVESLPPWWLYRMLHTPDQLTEKITLFWHGHFATSAAKVTDARLMVQQHRLFRQHGRSEFGPFVQAISRDPAMLLYLDSATNRKTHPNENYAREVMELFALGTGAYTEADIQQLARAFTGWEVHRGRFRFNEYEHDTGLKTILGRRGKFGGEDGVRIVLENEASPQFIARKLFRYFLCDEPAAPEHLIEPLADQLRQNDFNVGPLVRRMLGSNLFFSHQVRGKKIRSPIELSIGLLRSLEATANLKQLAEKLRPLGQLPFYPPNVKGWDGGRSWINSATLIGRVNLVGQLVGDGQERFAGGDLANVIDKANVTTAEEVVDWALALLVAVRIPEKARASLIALADQQREPNRRVAAVIRALATLPEFQLG